MRPEFQRQVYNLTWLYAYVNNVTDVVYIISR